MAEANTPEGTKKPKSGWINLLVDYGPLAVFFLTYKLTLPADDVSGVASIVAVVKSTGAFILAAICALVISKWRLGTISRMLWLSTVLIVGFGGMTILLRDPFYVQVKPTALYVFFGLVLLGGWLKGKAFLQWLLEAAFEGLSDEGWLKLSRNWGIFFLLLAVLNEVLRHYLSFGDWLAAKLWVFLPLSFLFTFTQLPMLLKHGLSVANEEEVVQNPPPK
ncbi:inner membrane-spanning protein YciB [Altericroceibacterium endophyticum]|uniref:Inner membrane-spanning protein YciB n=1 Tax=Altericroceibacterium endophyticum TaxID=1808508 RepID=A0A6I4T3P3_9SPHN|nr:inner membrane-spanning protein YciB [Altericroceibacterium endophyticum]MXO64899.1 intracellular septation protein A [Altericroceibacterium endophyticum]